MLVVGEHELIEIEKKFAKFQNIPINDDEIRVPIDTKPKHRPALLNERLYQWRLLFYINEIQGIDPSMNLDFKNIYFHYKLHNFKTSFQVQARFTRSQSQDAIENSQLNEDSRMGMGESKRKVQGKNTSQQNLSVQSPTHPKRNWTCMWTWFGCTTFLVKQLILRSFWQILRYEERIWIILCVCVYMFFNVGRGDGFFLEIINFLFLD